MGESLSNAASGARIEGGATSRAADRERLKEY